MLNFDQNPTEKAQVMSPFTEAYHATEHIIASLLLVWVVKVSKIKSLRDRDESFEYAGSFGINAPSKVEIVALWEGILQKVLIITLMLSVFSGIEHRCLTAMFLINFLVS